MHSERSPSLGDRKRKLVADELARAAMNLLDSQTYDETTIEQIAAAAGVSRRTYHRYFRTKQDVFLHFVDSQSDALLVSLRQRPEDEPVGVALRQAIFAFLAARSTTDGELRMTACVRRTATLHAGLLERQHQTAGLIGTELARRSGADESASLKPRLLAELTLTAINAAVCHYAQVNGAVPLHELTVEALDVLARGTDSLDI